MEVPMGNGNKTLLLDFDGVIVDTFRLSYERMKKVVLNPPNEESYRKWFEKSIYDNEDYKLKNKGSQPSVSENDSFFKEYTPLLMKEKPVSGIADVIQELHKSHRLVIISSTINSPVNAYLDKHNLSQYFDGIYGGDTHTSKVAKIKMVFAEFNVTAGDCLFITDTLGDIREAEKAGVKSIGVTWGFHKLETLQKGSPVAIANTPEELLSLIRVTL